MFPPRSCAIQNSWNPSRNQEEPVNHDGTEPLSWGKKEERRKETSTGTKEERRRETSTGTPAGTRRNQQIMMEQNPCGVWSVKCGVRSVKCKVRSVECKV